MFPCLVTKYQFKIPLVASSVHKLLFAMVTELLGIWFLRLIEGVVVLNYILPAQSTVKSSTASHRTQLRAESNGWNQCWAINISAFELASLGVFRLIRHDAGKSAGKALRGVAIDSSRGRVLVWTMGRMSNPHAVLIIQTPSFCTRKSVCDGFN